MQDTTKDIFDTVRVYGSERNIYYHPQKFPFAEEQIGVFFRHSYEGLFTEGTESNKRTQWHSILAQDSDLFSVNSTAPSGQRFFYGYFLTYPYYLGDNGNYTVLDTNSIHLNGEIHESIHSKGRAELWISPHIGITKFIPFQSKPWKLIDYSTKQ